MSSGTRESTTESQEVDQQFGMLKHILGDTSRMRSREIAYEAVKNGILMGILVSRERLIEERLGQALDLSRTPIREALAILEHEGLIEAIPYKGLRVRPVTLDEFLGMYEAMGAIESVIARAAISHVTAADLDTLGEILDRAEHCIPNAIPEHLAACREFQKHLGDCAKKPFLTGILVGIEERSDLYLIHSRQQLEADKMKASVTDRRNILEAVRTGDADRAAAAAFAHAEAIQTRWRDLYPETIFPA